MSGFEEIRRLAQERAERAARMEAERAMREAQGPRPIFFRLKNGESAQVRFLEQDQEVVGAMMHEVPVEGRSWGRDVPCLDAKDDGDPCPGCERQLPRRYKGFINLVWYDGPNYLREESGKFVKEGKNLVVDPDQPTKTQIAVWNCSSRAMEELDEANSDWRGLTTRRMTVKRKGEKFDTRYTIKPVDPSGGVEEFTPEEEAFKADKPDPKSYIVYPTYDEFQAMLSGKPANNNPEHSAPPRKNIFMGERSAFQFQD
jgi:hypothetical protein